MSEPERLAIGGKIATVDIRTGDKTILAAEPGQGGTARTVVAVGAALCCEEAIAAQDDLLPCRPLRSTRLLLQGNERA